MLDAALGAVRVWCSGREGGVSSGPFATCNVGDHVGDEPQAVAENRRRVAGAAGLDAPGAWVWTEQEHGVNVALVNRPATVAPVADAAVTGRPGLPIAIVTADCAPVVIACDDAFGVVHAGHKGLTGGVLEAAVRALRTIGSGAVRAFLGPCIRAASYEFGAHDLARVVAVYGPTVASRTRDGRPALDLAAGVQRALERCSVDSFEDCGIDTATSEQLFSYRRDGRTGRQVTVATWS